MSSCLRKTLPYYDTEIKHLLIYLKRHRLGDYYRMQGQQHGQCIVSWRLQNPLRSRLRQQKVLWTLQFCQKGTM